MNQEMMKKFLIKIHNKIIYPRKFLLKRMPKNSICAEIGVYKGNFSKKILDVVKPKKLHLIDPWKCQKEKIYEKALYGTKKSSQETMDKIYLCVIRKFNNEIKQNKISIHRRFSHKVYNFFPDNYFDWIYIDGNHLYEFVKKDLELYYKKIKRGGFITGDDYSEIDWWRGGVKKAVDEFVNKGLVKKIKIKNGQFICKKLF